MRKNRSCRLAGMLAGIMIGLSFTGCFSLGVSDMSEYVARFPEVYMASWDLLSAKKIQMSSMVGDGSENHSANLDELVRRVDENEYRLMWVNVSDGEGKYPTTTISEAAFYLASTDGREKTVNFSVFRVDSDPAHMSFNISDIIGSSEDNLYENGQIVSNLPATIDVLYTGTVTLKREWTDVYFELDEKITLNAGDKLVFCFIENNDSIVSVKKRAGLEETTADTEFPVYEYITDPEGNVTKVQKTDTEGNPLYYKAVYDYKFSRYSDNDFSFSVDKVLLYVDE